MSSYDSILKWAREAKKLLKDGEVRAAEINLSMIVEQAKEEIKKQKTVDNARKSDTMKHGRERGNKSSQLSD